MHHTCSHQSQIPIHSLNPRKGPSRKNWNKNSSSQHQILKGTLSILQAEIPFSGPCPKTPTNESIWQHTRKAIVRSGEIKVGSLKKNWQAAACGRDNTINRQWWMSANSSGGSRQNGGENKSSWQLGGSRSKIWWQGKKAMVAWEMRQQWCQLVFEVPVRSS